MDRYGGRHQQRIEDVYIGVTGITGAGKSEFIRFCTDKEVVVGDGLRSQTSQVEDWTFMYNPVLRVHLIDTPGFDDTEKKDVQVLRDIAGWLGTTYKQKIMLSGIIYLHPISDNRLRGSALRNLYMFKQLCGPDCLPGVVLATTMWGLVNPEDGIKRENELRSTSDFWGEMEQAGSRVMRHLRTKESAMAILSVIIEHRHPMLLKIQDEMVNKGRGLEDTAAGMKVNEDLINAQRQHQEELAALRQDMKQADEASKREIARLMREQQDKIDANEKERKKLEANLTTLEEARARDMKAMEKRLEDQAASLKKKESEIDDFRESLKQREANETLNREERAALINRLNVMEEERVTEARELRASLQAAQRRSTGVFGAIGEFFSDLFHEFFD